ncbi:hydantoinase/oxoprolinase family protein [Weizmannia coagulans]|uniref:Hydantoinase/oxoprolinase n=2 Tax=Heyndrickxia TaxID=2837504 RepID=A0AAN0WDD2_HEYCO|nr:MULTISPECIES: hydantoinase/oxoprolinase family protein [Heyndrickxia]AJO24391.1 hydantoinase/oxoprolinase [Heyndrickxia coagulans]AKN54145.1 N-methylhydantoinase A [Heyndrickxia coagulans]APB38241.1 5-oxoprolinase [Heyndrickxia coagulans]ATW84232.1 5-oxoprolinase [Heyndrickxia coagulans]KGB30446.1 5-oxoprolinase [Heyndrickxia coagulans]
MKVATDIGGTFTDLVYVNDRGDLGIAKSHTTPPNFEQGVMDVIQQAGIEPDAIKTFIHGTTVIINALTERKGAKTGLITTKGFRDVLEIARGNRPDLYNVRYQKPTPFVERYLRKEVEERLNYKGEELTPLNKNEIKEIVDFFKKEKVEAIAVSFLHSYANPVHEQETVAYIKALWPEVFVTASHEITKEWREYERTNTAVFNAYVKPIATSYVNKLDEKQKRSNNYIMQSNGGTTTFENAKNIPIHIVESGPVAGIFGAAVLGNILGEKNIIAFDVGGTTAKCSLIENGEVKVSTDYYIERDDRHAGYPIKTPVVDIVEIGNGGGSIAWIDDAGSLKVGPKSAGALPGPVAYGQGGTEPTTTDANLLTGRLSPKNFDYTVNMDKVKDAIETKIANYFNISAEEAALGIIRIANSNMLNALKLISIRKGYNPREFSLIAFGGGGSMHAAALAKELGVKKVIIPVASSVFSAWGMLMTDLRHDYIQTYITRLTDLDPAVINREWENLENNAYHEFLYEDVKKSSVMFTRFLDMRYLGQEHTVKVPVPNGRWNKETLETIIQSFHELHEKTYTFKLENAETEIVNLHLTAVGIVEKPELEKEHRDGEVKDAIKEVRPVYFEDTGWVQTDIYDRDKLPTLKTVTGPAIIEEKASVTVLYEGQTLVVDEYGNLILEIGVE